MKKFTAILLLLLILPFFSGCQGVIKNAVDDEVKNKMAPITLSYWRVFDEEDDFRELIQAYNLQHPNIKIEYRKLRYSEY